MPEISREEFLAHRSPRRGRTNPERMRVPVWEWLVETRINAYQATQQFDGPSAMDAGPGWCFDRFGCSKTELADGRVVRIAGEHEDSYDPDFYIYNDVIVRHPDGRIEIFGYPEEVFPPTDFHSATLDEGRECIWITGNLGYPEQRRPGETQVYRLDLASFVIDPFPTHGDGPGWLCEHEAELAADGRTLTVRRGKFQDENGDSFDRVDDWSLDLTSGEWTRLTERPFQQWAITRKDEEDLMLFDMSCLAFDLQYPRKAEPDEVDRKFAELGIELDSSKSLANAGRTFDAEVYAALYEPPVAFVKEKELDDTEEHEAHADNTRHDHVRLRVDGAVVRYAEEGMAVRIKIEGELSPKTVRTLRDDLVKKLAKLQNAPCEATLEWEQP